MYFIQQGLKLRAGALKLLVLQLQLDLVDLQFVEQPLRIGLRLRICDPGRCLPVRCCRRASARRRSSAASGERFGFLCMAR